MAKLFRIHYWDNALSPLAGRSTRRHLIRYDPRNLSRIFVTVRLVRLIETLAVDAIRNHTEKIDATSLRRLSTPPLLPLTHRRSSTDSLKLCAQSLSIN